MENVIRILANQHIRRLFTRLLLVLAVCCAGLQAALVCLYGSPSLIILLISIALSALILLICFGYFRKEDARYEEANIRVGQFLSGQREVRINCDEEGEEFRLYQSVNTLASVLNAQREQENRNSEFLRETISDISHQLKTPLAALNIYIGLIEDTEDTDEIRHFAGASESELERMDTLIRNLMKLARLDAGGIRPERHPEIIADIMADLKQRFDCRAGLEGKEIRLAGDETVFPCDRAWLSEAFGNILKNALDHTSSGGIITAEWKRSGNLLSIRISDNGSGICPEDLPHIFKRFYRSRYSKDTQGIGLGLPLAKTIIEAHNGIIEAESTPGKGTVFTVSFVIPAE